MKVVEVFYYYYYLFYTKIIPDDQPNATVIFTISIVQSLWISILIDIISLSVYCYYVNKWSRLIIALLLIVFNSWFFYKNKNIDEIINSKPNFFGKNKLTIIIVSIVSLIGVSWMFWGGVFAKNILGN